MRLDKTHASLMFKKFVYAYDTCDERVKLKISHTYHVAQIAEHLAVSMNWKEEDVELAYLIGLLHDMGRFEQLRQVHGFLDHKLDHADMGCRILFQEGWMRSFLSDRSYDKVIKEAIQNHNRFEISKNLNEIEMRHARLIRDADKLDIFRVRAEEPLSALIRIPAAELEKQMISDEVYECFLHHQCVRSSIRKTDMDCWISSLAMVFDLNYRCSCDYLKKYVDLSAVWNRITYNDKTNQQLNSICYEIEQYLQMRQKE